MKTVIVLEGARADWDVHRRASAALTESGGENMVAAMHADPGVMSCPGCGEYFLAEGTLVRCTECQCEWRPRRHGAQAPPEERARVLRCLAETWIARGGANFNASAEARTAGEALREALQLGGIWEQAARGRRRDG